MTKPIGRLDWSLNHHPKDTGISASSHNAYKTRMQVDHGKSSGSVAPCRRGVAKYATSSGPRPRQSDGTGHPRPLRCSRSTTYTQLGVTLHSKHDNRPLTPALSRDTVVGGWLWTQRLGNGLLHIRPSCNTVTGKSNVAIHDRRTDQYDAPGSNPTPPRK